MIQKPRVKISSGLLTEYALMVVILLSIASIVRFFITDHYLPQPFVFDTNDTFMDWFNTALYAYRSGAFDVWQAVYPPLSFVFLRIFSINSCYGSPFPARNCDWVGLATIVCTYLIDCALAAVAFARHDRTTALPRTIAFAFGLPLLFTLERGNLILVCLIPFILGYGELLGTASARALAIAFTVNFKPYLVVPSLSLALRRDWRGLELAGIFTFALYLVTLALYGSGTPLQIVNNLFNFASITQRQFLWQDYYYSTSYSSTLALGAAIEAPLLSIVPSRIVETIKWLIPVMIVSTQLAAVTGLVAAWLQPRAFTIARNAALLAAVNFATKSAGGYTETFLIFLVFLEKERRPAQFVALIAAYLLSVPYDHVVATVISSNSLSWLSGQAVHMHFGLAIGHFVRPALVMLIVWALALDNVTLSILAHRRTRPSLGLSSIEESCLV